MEEYPVDEGMLSAGPRVWQTFNEQSNMLDDNLHKFQEGVQELGSSLNLALSTQYLRDCVRILSWMVRQNASQLFSQNIEPVGPPPLGSRHLSDQMDSFDALQQPLIKPICIQLEVLANAISNLKDVLMEFPDLGVSGHRPLDNFQNDLKYWSFNLMQYKDTNTCEVKLYVHAISKDLGDFFQEISHIIKAFTTRVPAVRLSQQHAMSSLQNFATIATFFSAVTATTLQYSFTNNDNRLSEAVNIFWFSSLVFSITSALNSSLVLMWRSARYSSPKPHIPGWLWIWIRQSPPVFLLLAVLSFLAGLGCFVIASQKTSTWIVILVCEGLCSCSLIYLLMWLIWDMWSSNSTHKRAISGDKVANSIPNIKFNAILQSSFQVAQGLAYSSTSITPFTRLSSNPQGTAIKDLATTDIKKETLGHIKNPPRYPPIVSDLNTTTVLSPARQRWRNAFRRVVIAQGTLHGWREDSHLMKILQDHVLDISKTAEEYHHEAVLKTGAILSGMAYNSKGTTLAVCGNYLIIKCETSSNNPEQFVYVNEETHQVAWSHDGSVLIRTDHSIYVWPSTGNLSMITPSKYPKFVLCLPDLNFIPNHKPSFILINGKYMNKISILHTDGKEYKSYKFDNISIHYAESIPGGTHILLSASVFCIPQTVGSQPRKVSPMQKLIVFDLESFTVRQDIPLGHSIQHLAISQDGQMILVTLQNELPPQLWNITKTARGLQISLNGQLWSPFQKIKGVLKFSGKGQFLNKDRFILCTTVDGEIHFWRRDEKEAIHAIRAARNDEDKIQEVACNPAREDFTFATRSRGGKVTIWRAQSTLPEIS